MPPEFTLTGTVKVLLALVAAAGVLYFLWIRLQWRLRGVQYGVTGLIVLTATIHMLHGANNYLLYLNGVGFLALLTLLYFAPLGPLETYRRWLYGILALYTAATLVGYFVIHPWGVWFNTPGMFAKTTEIILLLLLAIDFFRHGQPVAPLIIKAATSALTETHRLNGKPPDGVPALEIHGLTYSYPNKPNVLKNINLTIQPGERVGLIGPNGAGKTTLFMSLVGIQKPEGGEITLFGQSMKHRDFRPEVGMVFQKSDDQLFSPSVRDDVAFGPENLGLSPAEVSQRVEAALSATGVGALAERAPHHLSGGEKRMVSIAGVMAMQPHLVIYDEPSANLDIRSRRRLIEFLQQANHAFIISSHDLEFLLEVCERVILLDAGQVVADGPPREIMNNPTLMEAHGLERPHSRFS